MANTYYDSALDSSEIEAALEAVDGLIDPANNGKVVAVENGALVAKSVTEYMDVPELGSKTITINGTYDPADDGLDGYNSVTVNVGSSGSVYTKTEMTECTQDCYLYSGGTRGWAVYPDTAGASGSHTFYADIPSAFQNGGYILMTTERPDGSSYTFTRNRIGFTNGTEDPDDLPNGVAAGNTTPPDYYYNALSSDGGKQFSLVKAPTGMTRVYWTNTLASYYVAGQKSYIWFIVDVDLLNAIGFDWLYFIKNSPSNEGTITPGAIIPET